VFDLRGQTAVITGGGGVLCSTLGLRLGARGVEIAVLDLLAEPAQRVADAINEGSGKALACDVLDRANLELSKTSVLERFGRVDILINGAGGNKPQATTNAERSFFDLPADAMQWVFNLNCLGTILPSQVFGKSMAQQGHGVILNISSMNSLRPLTRIPAYSASKAAVSNFTQWMAVHMAQEYSPAIRVNGIAPGFFLTEQNRFLLTDSQKRRVDRTRPKDHRPHPRRAVWQAGRSGIHGGMAALAWRSIHHRGSSTDRRRLFSIQRRLRMEGELGLRVPPKINLDKLVPLVYK